MKSQALQLLQEGQTPAQVAKVLGINPGTVRVWKSRIKEPGESNPKPKPTAVTKPAAVAPASRPAIQVQPKKQSFDFSRLALYGLLIAPTAASVQNAFHVGAQIMGDVFGAICLTVVLSVTALGFVAAGARNWYTLCLAIVLVAYESFCNLTRIYGGLMHGGKFGTSEFLGLVTDVFGSGSHYTAVTLAGFTAMLLAAVQYVSLFQLSKR